MVFGRYFVLISKSIKRFFFSLNYEQINNDNVFVKHEKIGFLSLLRSFTLHEDGVSLSHCVCVRCGAYIWLSPTDMVSDIDRARDKACSYMLCNNKNK